VLVTILSVGTLRSPVLHNSFNACYSTVPLGGVLEGVHDHRLGGVGFEVRNLLFVVLHEEGSGRLVRIALIDEEFPCFSWDDVVRLFFLNGNQRFLQALLHLDLLSLEEGPVLLELVGLRSVYLGEVILLGKDFHGFEELLVVLLLEAVLYNFSLESRNLLAQILEGARSDLVLGDVVVFVQLRPLLHVELHELRHLLGDTLVEGVNLTHIFLFFVLRAHLLNDSGGLHGDLERLHLLDRATYTFSQ